MSMNESGHISENHAYIDGQNLYLGTTRATVSWSIDLARFRVYLQKKYRVGQAYYFLGFVNDAHTDLYEAIQRAGFIFKRSERSESVAFISERAQKK
jgi:hypothetical protein